MKIFIDFDRTSFNVDQLYELLEREGAPQPGTKESLEYLDDPKKSEMSVAELVYSDVKEKITEWRSLGHQVFLVSSPSGFSGEWSKEYQEEKLKRSGLADMVDGYEVTSEKASYIASKVEKGERFLFVDDNDEYLSNVLAELSAKGFVPEKNMLIRGILRSKERRIVTGPESVEQISEFKTVKSFEQLDSITHPEKDIEE